MIPPLFLLLLLLLLISLHSLPGQSYSPPDSIAIDCGSSYPLSHDPLNRPWIGDTINSNFTLKQTQNSPTTTLQSQTQPITTIPYYTVRLSPSPFSYLFSLSSLDPVFLRLHFYPNTYGDFDSLKAFFEVRVNQWTLLSNFSPSLNSKDGNFFVKEYSLNPLSKTLNLTFAPSDSMPDSFAFVNGIEIVSIPSSLYYGSDEPIGFNYINQANSYHLSDHTALELAYRLNIGGSYISTVHDTGMFREWTADDNFYNVIGALPEGLGTNLTWTKTPNYTAPDSVYLTARTMGNSSTQNYEYNLTWNLPVDSGFSYWVRLHFCEFQKEVQKQGDRVFFIYINNYTAEEQADVIGWAGGALTPVYRDYVVIVSPDDQNKKQNLSIALHPLPRKETDRSDAILNGVEVFKLSDPSGSLAAANPDVATKSSERNSQRKGGGTTSTGLIVGICATIFLILGLILGFLLFFRRRRRGLSTKETVSYVSVKSRSSGGSASTLPADLCRCFSIGEIRAATRDFDKVFIIGKGGFGDVYKGHIDGMDSAVAIKRLNPGSKQGAREFMTEIEMLSQLRHHHLVSLIGYCNDEREMILVYDYMSRGTLRDHLYKSDNPPLSWKQRLEICIGSAKGLHYLHSGAKHMIIHRDVKSTNILLDDKFVAKVSDFGLSKMNTTDKHISTVVKGSFGYLDPEYYRRQQLTEKSDVYSFGVVLLEVLCARPVLDTSLEREQKSLAFWAQKCYEKGTIDRIIDPNLTGRIAPGCLKKFVEIAMSCLNDEGIQRPSMNDLVWSLEFALQLHNSVISEDDENALLFNSDSHCFEGEERGVSVDSSNGVMSESNKGTSFTTSSGGSDDKMSSGAVFSEIMNPTPR